MGRRQFPWDLRDVPWSQWQEFTRGTQGGIILLSWGLGPREKLATRRQLRAMGKRPGGQTPAALLYFRNRVSGKHTFAELFLIELAKPVRPMTPARWVAIEKALAARRTCLECGEDAGVYLPRDRKLCDPCRYSLGVLDSWDHLHDYVDGTPTFLPNELAAAQRFPAGESRQVIPAPSNHRRHIRCSRGQDIWAERRGSARKRRIPIKRKGLTK